MSEDKGGKPRKGEAGKSDLLLIELLVKKPGLTEEEARRELNFPKGVGVGRGVPETPAGGHRYPDSF